MDKHFVRSEKEYIKLFDNYDLEDAEKFLGVEYAFKDGSYQDNTFDEEQEVSREVFRKTNEACFPEAYPCLVLLANEKDFDRCGSIAFELLNFVYLGDFNGSIT